MAMAMGKAHWAGVGEAAGGFSIQEGEEREDSKALASPDKGLGSFFFFFHKSRDLSKDLRREMLEVHDTVCIFLKNSHGISTEISLEISGTIQR